MRRSFSLVELLVSMALASLLVGLVALLFLQSSNTRERVLDQIDRRQQLHSAVESLAGDCRSIVALAELPRFFHPVLVEHPRLDREPARADSLEMLVLGEDERLRRVRYTVEWSEVTERGELWREVLPVEPTELPLQLRYLASTEPPESKLVLSGLSELRYRFQDQEDDLFSDPPVEPPLDGDPRYLISGFGGELLHDRLIVAEPILGALEPGVLVWLKDDRLQRQRFEEGPYPLRRAGERDVSFARRIGESDRVFFRAAWIPGALEVDITDGGARHRRRLDLRQKSLTRLYLHRGSQLQIRQRQ